MKENLYSAQLVEPNDVARRFGTKAGFQLIDFTQVALPVFVVSIDAIVIAAKPLQLVDEFLLRSVTEGVNTLEAVSGFLGLENVFVKKRLAELVGQDLLAYGPGEDGIAKATLTTKGRDALKKALVVHPKRVSDTLNIDGITRQPLSILTGRLLPVRDARAFGLREVRAFPVDKAPDFLEIGKMDLTTALAKGPKKNKNIQRVMSLVHLAKTKRRYREATMLIFRAERGRQILVEFIIDGRPSPALNDAFRRHDGAKALHIAEQIEASIVRTEREINTILPNFVHGKECKQAATIRPKLQPLIHQVGLLESRIEEKENSINESASMVEIEVLKGEVTKLRAEKLNAENELKSIETRYLEVHEHRPLFERSLREAKSRILIISPWIRDSVLHSGRLEMIKRLVASGVQVVIGYGLGEDDKRGNDKGHKAIKFLNQLAQRYQNFHFYELGDTHAKILLVDDRYCVVGSFNWLSFEGSAKREFREEISIIHNKKEVLDHLFQRYLKRCSLNA